VPPCVVVVCGCIEAKEATGGRGNLEEAAEAVDPVEVERGDGVEQEVGGGGGC
jgi:hypothetical protein